MASTKTAKKWSAKEEVSGQDMCS